MGHLCKPVSVIQFYRDRFVKAPLVKNKPKADKDIDSANTNQPHPSKHIPTAILPLVSPKPPPPIVLPPRTPSIATPHISSTSSSGVARVAMVLSVLPILLYAKFLILIHRHLGDNIAALLPSHSLLVDPL
jgi:hypothetical protein